VARAKARPVAAVISDLDRVDDIDSDEGLIALEKVVAELTEWEYADPDLGLVRALLGVLERTSGQESYGIFWAIIHILEAIPNYRRELRESFGRRPTFTTATMLIRHRPRRGSADRERLERALRRKATDAHTKETIRDFLSRVARHGHH
jgi:hypothetical protein